VRVFNHWTTWAQAEAGLRDRVAGEDLETLRQAFGFARACHGDQLRPTGEPYERHLLEAVEVRARFGPRVAELVDWVTKADPPDGGDPAEARLGYLRRLASAPREAVLVKLADRLSNVQRLDRHPRPEKRRSYYRETVEWVLPLAAGVPFFHEQFDAWREQFAELG
jgi:(p)ppGpp synthase/HD superfamily hydrolase